MSDNGSRPSSSAQTAQAAQAQPTGARVHVAPAAPVRSNQAPIPPARDEDPEVSCMVSTMPVYGRAPGSRGGPSAHRGPSRIATA